MPEDSPSTTARHDPPPIKAVTPVLLGDSHSGIMISAALKLGFPLRGVYFGDGPKPTYNDDITALHPDIARLLEQGRVFSAVSQSMHDVLTLLQHPRSFDFVLPQSPELSLEPNAETIPIGAVRDALRRHMDRDFKVMALVHALSGDRLVHIISPPPLADNWLVAQTSPWSLQEGQSISPPALRLKAYRVYASLLAQWCMARGLGVINPPPQALTSDGFLRVEYCYNATHANEAYAHLVLAQMQEWL